VDRAGAVFAAQVSYLVTGFGVLWSMMILSERYSPFIWAALVLVLLGVALVQPRRRESLAEAEAIGDSGRRSDATGRAQS
jgi:drug/metabolite transporter (DMT)-like permease